MERSDWIIPATILLTSFLGSWHCAGMCGPFAALTGSRGQLWHYHLGRGIAYASLGAVAGSFGGWILSANFSAIRWGGQLALSGILIWMGLRTYFQFRKGPASHDVLTRSFSKLYQKLARTRLASSSFSLGIMSGLLPCGWLYTYVFAAAASKGAVAGTVVMSLFWLGGLPALSAVSAIIKTPLGAANRRQQKIAGLILVASGFYALAAHFFLHAVG